MTRKLIVFLSALYIGLSTIMAGEGMWIPLFLQQNNEAEMKAMGMRISAQDIYDINNASLKDAIVLFGGGCTGEIVSEQGLLFTNHHCGYGVIQSHSTLEHDYLSKGFWAGSQKDELPGGRTSATLLVYMEDVTTRALDAVNAGMTEKDRNDLIASNIKAIVAKAIEGTHYKAYVRPFFYGNQYFLFVTEVFEDVRLVGAPPSSIGKFGGDTDNWMWPRHTGDFSVFRIYAGKDNKPAAYHKDNVPYKPRKHLSISLKGVKEGDFTFVFGYPGQTQEYLYSDAVSMTVASENPVAIRLRETRLGIMDHYMSQDPKVRIQYSAKYAGVANFWKKMIGENRGVKRMDAIRIKEEMEASFKTWVTQDPVRTAAYGNLLPTFEATYNELVPLNLGFTYFLEAGHSIELVRFAMGYTRLVTMCQDTGTKPEAIEAYIATLRKNLPGFFKDYHLPVDRDIMVELLTQYREGLTAAELPSVFAFIDKKFKGNMAAYADYVFSRSILANQTRLDAFLASFRQADYKKLQKDPAYMLAESIYGNYWDKLSPRISLLESRLDSLYRVYMKAKMEMEPAHRWYPDANSTLRVTYGKVQGYYPADAVAYHWFTTLDGVMEKDNPDVYDYVVDPRLKELYAKKDYGIYADPDGKMHTCFIASNHTTGGNSGSPVLDADGHLIGINFDRNWEGTMSDLIYDPDQCRNISIDIRYVLFIIDKFAGASHLIGELEIVR
jgi:hypothetical protein